MGSVSNISVGASYAGNYATKARHDMNASIMRLSSGNRTVMGGDSAGASVANNLEARAKSHYIGARNAEDGISALLTAEAAMNEIANLAMRVRELGIQADNDPLLSDTDMTALATEATALYTAIQDIIAEAKFNEIVIINTASKTHAIGVSADGTNNTTITTNNAFATMTANIQLAATLAASGAEASADVLLEDVGLSLGNIAAGISALKGRQAVSYATSANLEAAAARIRDTDFAKETASLTKASILNQSAMAMVAQANQAQSAILAVLQ